MREEQISKVADNLDDFIHCKTDRIDTSTIAYFKELNQPLYDRLVSILAEGYNEICGRIYHRQRVASDADKRQIKIDFDK